MEIEYTNLYGKPINNQQIALTKIYIKIFKQNNRLRKKEYYENNILFNELNYLDFGSSHQDLLALNTKSLGILEMEDISANYTKLHSFVYYNNILEKKGIEIQSNKKTIMTQDLDIQTNLPIYNKTYKYYEDQLNGYEFEFKYYDSGELASVIVSNDAINFNEQYKFSELNLIPNFEWWNQYSSYYLNA